ncbi:MAG TPA: RNHCP domain-containing protein [Candidatus Paceibacterota bacterium]|jgi:hypothetical protein|nr:RNHCP domain-containing protein [Candidatus Paceibacterota bacterium]HOH11364.1 RNHCP domain-containing protein [Candidatus Paceibacterota bacterium]HPB60401.1 RNHCP domain-containing protein [Candidatus Paceibacterota bacterium]HPY13109.1 RNHCP domain-containing protein [Candidatus Paceibacterota bacterium]HQB27166.1 RNHCP domain-containing protein [Candidatus Paceibacterota bacterium]
MSSKFQRTIEDFSCAHCGFFVPGDGFTNHCPKCLWSRHVDNYPGDRANDCLGLMEPTGLELEKGQYVIVHECQKCRTRKRVKARNEDDIRKFLQSML